MTLDTRASASFDLYYRSSTRFASYTTKYMDENIKIKESAENDWIVLRYADIKLLYAEVLAQDGGFADAHIHVNDIRRRAGKPEAALLLHKPWHWILYIMNAAWNWLSKITVGLIYCE